MSLRKSVLGGLLVLAAVAPALPADADTVVERTCYRTSTVPVRKKVTMYNTSYVPVTRKRVVYEKAMVPVRHKVTAYKTSWVPVRSKSVARLASAPETTTIERKVVTTRTTEFIPTSVVSTPMIVRTSETLPSSLVVSPTVVRMAPTIFRTVPIVTSAPAVVLPETRTFIFKEKHHKTKIGTLQPVIWY